MSVSFTFCFQIKAELISSMFRKWSVLYGPISIYISSHGVQTHLFTGRSMKGEGTTDIRAASLREGGAEPVYKSLGGSYKVVLTSRKRSGLTVAVRLYS